MKLRVVSELKRRRAASRRPRHLAQSSWVLFWSLLARNGQLSCYGPGPHKLQPGMKHLCSKIVASEIIIIIIKTKTL